MNFAQSEKPQPDPFERSIKQVFAHIFRRWVSSYERTVSGQRALTFSDRSSLPYVTTRRSGCPSEWGDGDKLNAHSTACFTRALSLASSSGVKAVSAKAVGQQVPSSSFATSLKPSVAYRALNLYAP